MLLALLGGASYCNKNTKFRDNKVVEIDNEKFRIKNNKLISVIPLTGKKIIFTKGGSDQK